eukprot:TRINITY_DN9253_c0_g3_i1.p1 TRINITY_DN9253_c0_g3~~TRINITY_DN9253_c0_g3_i1.p1  ORF type:complete len:571 (+),score=64.73 TRINITY_DN9253_c0_g3_i1:133-1845(+)
MAEDTVCTASTVTSLSRQVLRDELQEFAETLLQTALDRTREELVAAVAEASRQGIQAEAAKGAAVAQSCPPMHAWMRRRPMRYRESDALCRGGKRKKAIPMTEGGSQPLRDFTPTSSATLGSMSRTAFKGSMTLTDSGCHEAGFGDDRDSAVHTPSIVVDTEVAYSPLLQSCSYAPRATFLQRLGERVRRFVRSDTFEHIAAVAVLVNAAMMGMETSLLGPQLRDHAAHWLLQCVFYAEQTFCVVFTLELLLKLFTFRSEFFCGNSWKLNMFDTCIVTLQLADQVSHATHTEEEGPLSVSTVKCLRLLRLLRIVRLLRVLHLVDELQHIIISLVGSLSSLGWVLMMLSLLVYFFSVLFTQMALINVPLDDPHYERIMHFFGSIPNTVLTLFGSIFGGVQWDEPVLLLNSSLSPTAGILFCLYIAFCLIAVMNVVTGVFVDKALRSACVTEEKTLAKHVARIFFDGDHANQQISWETFEAKLTEADMEDYFKAIDVDESEAQNLFELLDTDNSGGVDARELVTGLLRLRGNAGSLEVALMMRELSYMHDRLEMRMQDALQKQRSSGDKCFV